MFHTNSEGCTMHGAQEGKDGKVKRMIVANVTFPI